MWKADFCTLFQPGQVILKEGELGNSLLVLLEGQVEVQIKDQVVGMFEPVEVFGEMSVIDSQPRSATVIAKTKCKLAKVDQNRFKQLIQNKPDFGIDIMRMLVERIRWMDSVTTKQAALAPASDPVQAPLEKSPMDFKELKTALETLAGQIAPLLDKLKNA